MRAIPAFLVLALLTSPALPCSLCPNLSRAVSLVQEFEQADAILYGRIANPQLQAGGKGVTDFHVEKFVKDAPGTPRDKKILLNRYLPIIDPKEPPCFVMFFHKDTTQPYTGREVRSPVILDFVAALQRYRDNPAEMCLLAFKYLDHADTYVADEAFLVLARADDKTITNIAKKLEAPRLRQLLKTPNLEPERLNLYAFLLGACGDGSDVEVLRSLLKDRKNFKAFEGILAGYIALRPEEGWAYLQDLVKNEKTEFLLRFASLRTLRFFYNAKPEENGTKVLQSLGTALERADVADIAISDLRIWKQWQHTKTILACYDKASHRAPIIKTSIVRYALACPQPEARELVERVRRQDPELLKYLEEELK